MRQFKSRWRKFKCNEGIPSGRPPGASPGDVQGYKIPVLSGTEMLRSEYQFPNHFSLPQLLQQAKPKWWHFGIWSLETHKHKSGRKYYRISNDGKLLKSELRSLTVHPCFPTAVTTISETCLHGAATPSTLARGSPETSKPQIAVVSVGNQFKC